MAKKQPQIAPAILSVHSSEDTQELTATANEREKTFELVRRIDPLREEREKMPRLDKVTLCREIAVKLAGQQLDWPPEWMPMPEAEIKVMVSGDLRELCQTIPEEMIVVPTTYKELRVAVRNYIDQAKKYKERLRFHGLEAAFRLGPTSIDQILQEIEDGASYGTVDQWKPLRKRGEKVWALRELPIDIEPLSWEQFEKLAPVTSKWLCRASPRESVPKWLYDLITGGGSSKKQLWIHGPKNAFKSSLAVAVGEYLSTAFTMVPESHFTDQYQFLGADIFGKLLVLVDDVKGTFPRNSQWKTVTGSQTISVNRKHKDVVCAQKTCRFIVTSNEPPSMPLSDTAIATRLAVVKMSPVIGPTIEDAALASWKAAMRNELPYLLGYGMTLPPIPEATEEEMAQDHEFAEMATKFVADPAGTVEASQMVDFYRINGITASKQQAEFKAYLSHVFGVKEERTEKRRFWRGIRLIHRG